MICRRAAASSWPALASPSTEVSEIRFNRADCLPCRMLLFLTGNVNLPGQRGQSGGNMCLKMETQKAVVVLLGGSRFTTVLDLMAHSPPSGSLVSLPTCSSGEAA